MPAWPAETVSLPRLASPARGSRKAMWAVMRHWIDMISCTNAPFLTRFVALPFSVRRIAPKAGRVPYRPYP
eukprot:1081817-Prorocentrum_minimum.AAC.4